MSSETGLEDLSLIELFRSEVETHAEVLSAALLALEQSPGDGSRLGEMMRAAHSIKGAARIVEVAPAVMVAHAMEDCFVAAQKGALALSPADIDVLLRGVDLLNKVSGATRDPGVDLGSVFDGPVKSLVNELGAMLVPGGKAGGGSTPVGAPASVPPGPEPLGSAAAPTAAKSATIAGPEILDATAAEEVRRRFLAAIEGGCDTVRLDLRATKDLDVQGLALLAAIGRHAAGNGRPHVRLAGVSAPIETVLRVTGLSESYALGPDATPEEA